jgi:predicted DNA-binding transcriptional regulator AlpA
MPANPTSAVSTCLIGIDDLSVLLGRSVPSLQRDDRAGRIPRGIKLGRSKRWRLDEIHLWIAAGCPSRSEWEARRPK